jgi:transcriptional regulator with XRE-family HTH domain
MVNNKKKSFDAFINSLTEFEIKKEDHPDDDSQLFFLLSDFILDIINLRKKNHLSQKEVAERMGTKQASISRFENFNTKPKLEYLYKIVQAVEGKLYITPNGDYIYTVPEEYRDVIDKLAMTEKIKSKEMIEKLFIKVLEEVVKSEELIK